MRGHRRVWLRRTGPILVCLLLVAGCATVRLDDGGVSETPPADDKPVLVITHEAARELFGGREARMLVHYPGPRMHLFRSKQTGPVYLVDFGRDPLALELVVPDAQAGLLGDPMLSPDGTRLCFLNGGSIYAAYCRPGGRDRTKIGEGFDPRWWRHPATGEEYIIWVDGAFSHGNGVGGTTRIRRLERGTCEPAGPEKVLLRDYAFRGGRSPDGRYMCTGLPGCALAELVPGAVENALVRIVHSGPRMCNPSMSQDPAHPTWFLWSPRKHGRLHYDPADREASIPPPSGYGCIQWPEWSTHADFLTASPSADEDDGNPVLHDAFIYRWSTKTWTQVTRKAYATHLWVGESAGATDAAEGRTADARPAEPEAREVAVAAAGDHARVPDKWPGDPKGLLFLWENGKKGASVTDADGRPLFQTFYAPLARGLALFDRHHALRLEGGAFVAEKTEQAFLAALQKTRSMTLEMVVTPSGRNGRGRAVIAALASGRERGNLFLVQEGGELKAVVRGSTAPVKLCPLPPGRPTHVAITCDSGRLTCYRDGAKASEAEVAVDFASWEPHPLVLGDVGQLASGAGLKSEEGEDGWIGLLEGVALYGRSLSAEEVRADSAAYRRRIGTRTPAPRIEVEAKLVARSTTPAPKETVYDRGYTVFEYERVGPPAASGKDLPDRFRVAHWAEMENRCLEVAGRREGLVYRLELEQLDDNPQMEEEQVFDTLEEDLDLTVYYDIGPLGFAAREP